MRKKKYLNIIWIICMTAVSFIVLLPIFMMISTSLKTTGEINSAVFHFLPESLHFENYTEAMTVRNIVRKLKRVSGDLKFFEV